MNNALFVEPGSNPKRMQELAEVNFQKSQNGHNAIIVYLLFNCKHILCTHLIFDAVSSHLSSELCISTFKSSGKERGYILIVAPSHW